ncbi:MAG: hypothetical protein MI784_15540, partial [Cytophagales bacterium]|nr:hypothetical protein [Cytophagales bacterium]
GDSLRQLEVIVLKPLKTPMASLFYKMPNGKVWAGSIGSKGIHRFSLPRNARLIEIRDPLLQISYLNLEIQ